MEYKIIDGLKTYKIPKNIVENMFEVMKAVAQNTYPIPNKVSCAVLTSKGNIYPGAEYRSDVMILSMHAEATALANAAIHGEKGIIAITGPNCHACKQLLWESAVRSGNNIVILIREDKKVKQVALSKMMKYAWPELA